MTQKPFPLLHSHSLLTLLSLTCIKVRRSDRKETKDPPKTDMRPQVEAQVRESSRVRKPIRTKDTNSVRAAAYYHFGTVSMIRVFAIISYHIISYHIILIISYMRYHRCTIQSMIFISRFLFSIEKSAASISYHSRLPCRASLPLLSSRSLPSTTLPRVSSTRVALTGENSELLHVDST